MADLSELLQKAKTLAHEKNYEEVLEVGKQMLDQDVDSVEALAEMANAYWHLGRLYRSEKYVEKALELDSGQPLVWYNQGLIDNKREHYKEATKSFRLAVKLQPDFSNAWNMLGLSLFQQGKMEEAELCLLKALELEPENEYAKKNLNAVRSHR
ncbi:MAG: tetratricopeptide repeat protein [Deltaproteobacteria bacterium]|nr:tetratricopeptide repeat protein [Candidatus Tharpellaceae bacterium]